MKKVALGFCLGTVGVTLLSSVSDIIITLSELAKAKIGVKIAECGAQINKINTPSEQKTTRAIGFATTNPEEEDDYDE